LRESNAGAQAPHGAGGGGHAHGAERGGMLPISILGAGAAHFMAIILGGAAQQDAIAIGAKQKFALQAFLMANPPRPPPIIICMCDLRETRLVTMDASRASPPLPTAIKAV